jgi:hypothetical protein
MGLPGDEWVVAVPMAVAGTTGRTAPGIAAAEAGGAGTATLATTAAASGFGKAVAIGEAGAVEGASVDAT